MVKVLIYISIKGDIKMRIYEQTIRYELYSIDELQGKSRRTAIDNVRELLEDMRDSWDFNMLLDDYFNYNLQLDGVLS